MALAAKTFSDLITFTRASTAGYYGSDGLYKTAASGVARTGTYADYKPAEITQQNILTYSSDYSQADWAKTATFVQTNLYTNAEDFTNAAWDKPAMLPFGSGSVANATTAPNGAATADLLVPTTTTTGKYVKESPVLNTSTVYTASIYAKPAGYNLMAFEFYNGAAFSYGFVNLSTGLAGTVASGLSITITAASNGFYRVSCTATTGATGASSFAFFICTADNDPVMTGNGTSGMYFWGAQLVQGSVAGDYRATTSAALPVLYADPLGTTLAQKLCETVSNDVHRIFQSASGVSGTVCSASVYVKAGERTRIEVIETTGGGGHFELSTGTLVSGSGTIVSVGSGWYRVSIPTSYPSSQIVIQVRIVNAANAVFYTGDGTSGVYVFGAQLNEGATALPYLATSTSGGHATTTGAKRGFLVEESRTNLLLRSNDWSATWDTTNVTPTASAAIGPDGTMSMTKLMVITSSVTNCAQYFVSTATSLVYTIYVKQGSGATHANKFALYNFNTTSDLANLSFDYATGVISQTLGSGATSEPIGNGIWRISIPVTSGISVGNIINVYACFTGGGATAGQYAYVYGAQVEAGAFATSYIPTTTAQVTRAADSARVNTLNPWFSTTGGTFYAEGTYGSYPATLLSMMDAAGYATNSVAVGKITPFRWSQAAAYNTGGNASLEFDTTTASVLKFAFSWDGTNIYAAANGQATKTAVQTLSLANTSGGLRLGEYFFGNMLNERLRAVRFYPRVITGTELSALTA